MVGTDLFHRLFQKLKLIPLLEAVPGKLSVLWREQRQSLVVLCWEEDSLSAGTAGWVSALALCWGLPQVIGHLCRARCCVRAQAVLPLLLLPGSATSIVWPLRGGQRGAAGLLQEQCLERSRNACPRSSWG